MKTLKLAVVLASLVAANAFALTVGTGSSVEVANVTGTITQAGATREVHQGVEVGVAGDATSGMAQVGTYKSVATGTSTFDGSLASTTTTTKGFSFND